MDNFKDLGKILHEQGSQLAKIGEELTQSRFLVIPSSMANDLLSYDEAFAKVSNTNEAVCIVRVIKYVEKKQKYGIVRHRLSPLNGRTVLMGVKNESGLVRCSDVEHRRRVDYVHESFIYKL